MDFLVSRGEARRITRPYAVLAVVVLIVVGPILLFNPTRMTATLPILLLGVGSIVIFPYVTLFFAWVLRLRIRSDQIEQLVLGKWILCSKPLTDLMRASLDQRLFSVELLFRDGSRMRLLEITHATRYNLAKQLHICAPWCAIEPEWLVAMVKEEK